MSQSEVTDYATALETLEKIHDCIGNLHSTLTEYIEEPEGSMVSFLDHANTYNDCMNAYYYLCEYSGWFFNLESEIFH